LAALVAPVTAHAGHPTEALSQHPHPVPAPSTQSLSSIKTIVKRESTDLRNRRHETANQPQSSVLQGKAQSSPKQRLGHESLNQPQSSVLQGPTQTHLRAPDATCKLKLHSPDSGVIESSSHRSDPVCCHRPHWRATQHSLSHGTDPIRATQPILPGSVHSTHLACWSTSPPRMRCSSPSWGRLPQSVSALSTTHLQTRQMSSTSSAAACSAERIYGSH